MTPATWLPWRPRMREQCVPGPLLSFVGPGNEAKYWYADDLPCAIKLYTVLSVIKSLAEVKGRRHVLRPTVLMWLNNEIK